MQRQPAVEPLFPLPGQAEDGRAIGRYTGRTARSPYVPKGNTIAAIARDKHSRRSTVRDGLSLLWLADGRGGNQ